MALAHAPVWTALCYAGRHPRRSRLGELFRPEGDCSPRPGEAVPHLGHAAPPDVAQAAASYQQVLALAEALGMHPLQAHCHRGIGTLYATTGQREQACIALSTAIAMYRGMEMTFWLPETEAVLAQVKEG
jgi:hypothetical protein